MPLWLRKITFNLINEYYQKQNEEITKQQDMLKSKKDISKPNISPTYQTSKASKK
jgi:hypothetical protein